MKKLMTSIAGFVALPMALQAGTVTHLREGWALQSACKMPAPGPVVSVSGFSPDGWLKATVPTTVLAAQAAAGAVPDPYYGDNLRQIVGTSYPVGMNYSNLPMPEDSPYHCGWWYRSGVCFAQHRRRRQAVVAQVRRHQLSRRDLVQRPSYRDTTTVAGAYRTYEFDVTEFIKPGGKNVLAVETFAPTEKDLGINWVDWNPCPPDKDMGLWGEVDLEETGPVTVTSPMVETHFVDGSLNDADLIVYAVLHNALDRKLKGVVSGSVAGVRFSQPIELDAHEDRGVSFSRAQFLPSVCTIRSSGGHTRWVNRTWNT